MSDFMNRVRNLPNVISDLFTGGNASGTNTHGWEGIPKEFGKFVNNVTGVTATQDFNKQMASTEYQRALADLKQAGLNPSVMYGGGSVGHSASSGGSGGGVYNAIGGTINSLIHAAVELHEDASPKNKNVAFHSANQMIVDELKKIKANLGAMANRY